MADNRHDQAATVTRRNAMQAGAAAVLATGVPLFWPGAARADKAKVDAVLSGAVSSGNVPGVVALAADDKGVLYEGAFGKRNLETGTAMTPDTMFWIASMTKAVTSTAAMQLVEQGKLSLDKPISDVVMELSAAQVLEGFDAEGKPKLRPPKRPITLRHLLTHTAGFSYRLWDAKAVRYASSIERLPAAERRRAPRRPLMFDPGERWRYGTNIDCVGRIVEFISGEPLDAYFRKHILDPLGMNDTAFVISAPQREREASVHRRGRNGSLAPEPLEHPPAPPRSAPPRSFSGGGGIYSTAPDYLTLIRTLLRGGSLDGVRILRPETVALMGQNQIGEVEVGVMKTTAPTLSNDVDFFPGINLKWGFGHMINMQRVVDGRSAGSLTWGGLLNTYYWIDPARRIAAVFMTQILPFADTHALRIYRQFERGIYAAV